MSRKRPSRARSLALSGRTDGVASVCGFDEVELRAMLHAARGYPDVLAGRYVIQTAHQGAGWEVVVEPDEVEHLLVVVTAFRASR